MAVVGLIIWLVSAASNPTKTSLEEYGKRLSSTIDTRKIQLSKILSEAVLAAKIEQDSLQYGDFWNNEYFVSLIGADFTIAMYKDDSLLFWNNASNPNIDLKDIDCQMDLLQNAEGLFLTACIQKNDYTFLLVDPIYRSYPIHNQYIKQGFSYYYREFSDKIKIIKEVGSISAQGISPLGTLTVFIDYQDNETTATEHNAIPFPDFLLAALLLLLFYLDTAAQSSNRQKRSEPLRFITFGAFLVSILVAYFVVGKLTLNTVSPEYPWLQNVLTFEKFAATTGLLFLGLCITGYRFIEQTWSKLTRSVAVQKLIWVSALTALLIAGEILFTILLQKISNADMLITGKGFTPLAMIQIIGLLFIAAATTFTGANIFDQLLRLPSQGFGAAVWLIPALSFGLFWIFAGIGLKVLLLVLPALLFFMLANLIPKFSLGKSFVISFVWIVVSTGFALIVSVSGQRVADEEQLLLAKKLSSDKDPMLEYLFSDLQTSLSNDSVLQKLLFERNTDDQLISNYLSENYLIGYLARYETEVTTCYADQDLILQPENLKVNCIGYFGSLLASRGDTLNRGSLHLIDNNLLGVHYVGYLTFAEPRETMPDTLHVFIEFFYKYIPEGTGYPELLIDIDKGISPDLNKFSFASYRDGQLYYKFGSYFFPLHLEQFSVRSEEFFNNNGYRHVALKYDDKTLIISRKNKTWAELLAPFSFVLLINGLLILLLGWWQQGIPDFRKLMASFRTRLQLLISVSLIVSFALIGLITTVYMTDIYRRKNDDFLSEKMQSLLVEMEHKLKDLPLTGPLVREYLNQLLLKFSLVFFTDINLYDINGSLLATSRPEIFEKGLTSNMMHPEAFRRMRTQNQLYFRHYEEIGKARFISAYAPFKNNRGEVIAYINLPYFVKETEMQREVHSMVLSYLNMFILLSALSLLFALYVSRRLTRPLQMIQMKMSRVQLNHTNEKIDYQRYDEIGELVNQYNTLLDQLALSAKLLARSERESAWREMARQVAHEIKNPLTPMRLSVQYLLKAWDDRDPDIDQKLKNISQTLISQIDTLSSIASAFSDFAVMPQPKPQIIDLAEVLNKVVHLFDHQENIRFEFHQNSTKPALVEADPENLNRIFTNLIKNSIQAIGNRANAYIIVRLGEAGAWYTVEVEDSGKGMTEEESRKAFTPNFTTKSSGMGMGLSIVYSLVQQSGGNIRFETHPGQGTKFILDLPKAKMSA